MKLTRTLFFTSTLFIPTLGFSAGAEVFKDLKSLQSQSFYRITCSDQSPEREIEAHVLVTINNGKVEDVKVVALAPALSIKVYEYNSEKAKALKVNLKDDLHVYGDTTGAYWPETISLRIKDTSEGLRGRLVYNDGDSARLDRAQMKCGASNFMLSPMD